MYVGPVLENAVIRFAAVFFALFGVVTVPSAMAQHETTVKSPYVRRMMSLDRNNDGFLTAAEIPPALSNLLDHDANGDQRLDASELARIEQKAVGRRDDRPAANSDSQPTGRRGRGGRRESGLPASPDDVKQILRFALTFDADEDGGLNASELRKYAAALAARRANGGRRRGERPSAGDSGSPESKTKTPGLGDPSKQDDASPFGSPPGEK